MRKLRYKRLYILIIYVLTVILFISNSISKVVKFEPIIRERTC